MRLTVTRKIALGIAVVVALGVLLMFLLYQGLFTVQQALVRLAEVNEPLQTAAHEMEINANGMCLGALGYLNEPDETYRRLVEKDKSDFETFHAQYSKLAVSEPEKELAMRSDRIHQELQTAAQSLIKARDQQELSLHAVFDGVEGIDAIIDDKLQAKIDAADKDRHVKLEGLNALESDLAEVNMWLAHYMRSHQADHARLIAINEQEFRANLERVQTIGFMPDERRWLDEVKKAFDQVTHDLRTALTLEETTHTDSKKLLQLQAEMDQLLDEQIQVIALEDLRRPRQEADAAASQVRQNVLWLGSLFLVSALGVTLVLVRTATNSLARLRSGTEAITRGDLNFRIAVVGRDEFADLAEAFNRMVAQLQATTVSKLDLEASDRRLSQTVSELRKEIADRRRAQEEQAQLQASLRRAETWSALGSLLAGVIHQVRNPLFGISSIVDAMDARFGARDEYRRYVGHLREQVTRISALLQELLEYAKPVNQERSPIAPRELIGDVLRACRPLAEQVGVQLVAHIDHDLGPLAADRAGLLRAFECLVENAVQHSPPGGVVRVDVRKSENNGTLWADCTVTDAGPGFCPEDITRVFEPFFTRRPGGTGLGLAIAHRIVLDHSGQVTAANGPEGGAVLTARLPLLESPGHSQGPSDDAASNSGD